MGVTGDNVTCDENETFSKKKEVNKKSILIIFSAAIAIVILSIILYLIIITKSPIGIIKEADSGAWLGFYGSIIGGAMTLIGVWWTIKQQEERRKDDLKELEVRRIEDRRNSILPFLSYIVDNDLKLEKEIPAGLILTPENFSVNGSCHLKSDLVTQIIVHNIGLGVAVNPYVLEIFYDNIKNKLGHETSIYLNVEDKASIPLSFILPDLSNLTNATIKIGYFNILRDFYEQTITFGFNITTSITVDGNRKPIRTEYKCDSIKIVNVESPILSDSSKYKGLGIKILVPDKSQI